MAAISSRTYLPCIEPDDTPATVSMRNFPAIPRTCLDFLRQLEDGRKFASCPQPAPLFYFRDRDWTVVHAQLARCNICNRLAARYQRLEKYIRYWECPRPARSFGRLSITRLV
jgi:hypothetical protein